MASKQPKASGGEQFQAIAPGTVQNVSYTGTAASSTLFSQGVSIVRVVATTDCYIKFGTGPTATTNDVFLPANVVEYFSVPEDGSYKVSAVRSTSSGSLNVTEGSST